MVGMIRESYAGQTLMVELTARGGSIEPLHLKLAVRLLWDALQTRDLATISRSPGDTLGSVTGMIAHYVDETIGSAYRTDIRERRRRALMAR